MIDFVWCFGQIVLFIVCIVYQNDQFSYCYGFDEDVQYVLGEGECGVMIYVYVVVKLKDGGV